MGTRSTVKFYDQHHPKKPILSIYNQYDGYISGVGHQLAEWLQTKTVINGYSTETMEGGFANGMGCLAAQYVRDHKNHIGGLYLTTSDDKQEYNYEVRMVDGGFIIKVDKIFEGSPDELLKFEQ